VGASREAAPPTVTVVPMTDNLPTARTTLRQDAWLCLLVSAGAV
jgi:hypothetical protein